MTFDYTFTRYLAAKKTVDDRALNQHVWQSLAQALPNTSPEQPLQVLEVGAGIGTMVERLLASGLLDYANYIAIDAQDENVAHMRRRLPDWGARHGYQVSETATGLILDNGSSQRLDLALESIDLFDFAAQSEHQQHWDLLVANAFLDLVDIPATLPLLFALLKPEGLFYFSINFDGETVLEPPIDRHLDRQIVDLYHHSMDARLVRGKPSGDSQAGRHLFTHLTAAGGEILDAGSSDWIVFAGPQGYPHDEAYFLHFVIETMHRQLRGHPALNAEKLDHWAALRHAQIERGELVYIAHQLDFLGSVRR
jgi:2-polyprenyl-3-methyl-5-hydroxy-6-metoxy-1,4-benzoquinol methylase